MATYRYANVPAPGDNVGGLACFETACVTAPKCAKKHFADEVLRSMPA